MLQLFPIQTENISVNNVTILQVKVKTENENMKRFLKLNRHLSEIENVFTK